MTILNQQMLLHGGDYNPDQWADYPEVLAQDMQLLKEANINFVSLNIFSWIQLEPREGEYTFAWLDDTIERLHKHGFKIVLATPSGGKPAWLSRAYPQSCRVNSAGVREEHGNRHNHCMSSPVYRQKVQAIDSQLAQRYGQHPAVILWHVSNEFSGYCYCDLCKSKFRSYLQQKYQSIEALNKVWWHDFWSHNFSSFDEIHPPMSIGEQNNIPLAMAWERFTTANTIDFFQQELAAIRAHSSVPATTNFPPISTSPMHLELLHLDAFEFAKHLDIVAYDSYPEWHSGDDYEMGLATSMLYDLMRSLKGNKPFLLMESAPSAANWRSAAKLKRPGMHLLSSMQALAHGADMIGYFQMRKGRGQTEKFHAAVIDHDSTSENRVFQEVRLVGQQLQQLSKVMGCLPKARIAIYFDWSNHAALKYNRGPRMAGVDDLAFIQDVYKAIVAQGYAVDFIRFDSDLSAYQVVVLPMVYAAPESFWQNVQTFAQQGGKVVSTYMSGYANEDDLIYANGKARELESLTALKYHELDALEVADSNSTVLFGKRYKLTHLCELNKNLGATVISTYEEDFYRGQPVISEHQGHYHLAARLELAGLKALLSHVFNEQKIDKVLELSGLPLIVSQRGNYLFIMNFTTQTHTLTLPGGYSHLHGEPCKEVSLAAYGYVVVEQKEKQ